MFRREFLKKSLIATLCGFWTNIFNTKELEYTIASELLAFQKSLDKKYGSTIYSSFDVFPTRSGVVNFHRIYNSSYKGTYCIGISALSEKFFIPKNVNMEKVFKFFKEIRDNAEHSSTIR